jgi:hypothetical protein
MNHVTFGLAADHLRELRDEAARRRLLDVGAHTAAPGPPAWRRNLAAGAGSLSLRLGRLAERLDPPRPQGRHAIRRSGDPARSSSGAGG